MHTELSPRFTVMELLQPLLGRQAFAEPCYTDLDGQAVWLHESPDSVIQNYCSTSPDPIERWVGEKPEENEAKINPSFTGLEASLVSLIEASSALPEGWEAAGISTPYAVAGSNPVIHFQYLMNVLKFQAELSFAISGILMVRSYDAFHGAQRTRVELGGDKAAPWLSMRQNRSKRLQWSAFGQLFEAPTSNLEIELLPPAGAPLWSFGELQIYALIPAKA